MYHHLYHHHHPSLLIIMVMKGMWWAVQTLTSLGYGDFSPQTILGKVDVGMTLVIMLMLKMTTMPMSRMKMVAVP